LESYFKASAILVLDLKSLYRQLMLHPDDRAITRFTVAGVIYRFVRLPTGLKHLPNVFQQLMMDAFSNLLGRVAIYIDDIIVGVPEKGA